MSDNDYRELAWLAVPF